MSSARLSLQGITRLEDAIVNVGCLMVFTFPQSPYGVPRHSVRLPDGRHNSTAHCNVSHHTQAAPRYPRDTLTRHPRRPRHDPHNPHDPRQMAAQSPPRCASWKVERLKIKMPGVARRIESSGFSTNTPAPVCHKRTSLIVPQTADAASMDD